MLLVVVQEGSPPHQLVVLREAAQKQVPYAAAAASASAGSAQADRRGAQQPRQHASTSPTWAAAARTAAADTPGVVGEHEAAHAMRRLHIGRLPRQRHLRAAVCPVLMGRPAPIALNPKRLANHADRPLSEGADMRHRRGLTQRKRTYSLMSSGPRLDAGRPPVDEAG